MSDTRTHQPTTACYLAHAAEVVGVRLTERPAEDGRASTAAVGQFVLEARAFVAAWERARQTYPE